MFILFIILLIALCYTLYRADRTMQNERHEWNIPFKYAGITSILLWCIFLVSVELVSK